MVDEHDDDLEAEVDDGAEIETERFAEASEDDEEAELLLEVTKSDREERPDVDTEEDDASDTI